MHHARHPALVAAAAAIAFTHAPPAADEIVDTAVDAASFKTLVAAVKLVDEMKGKGPFTVFAPTDEAFAKLPKGTVESLLENPSKLRAIPKYRVVAGRVPAAKVVGLTSAKTLNGQSVSITANGTVKVDDAAVIKTDIN